jgi:TonB-dependent SusC/RagA subfamily outer membrane receptor
MKKKFLRVGVFNALKKPLLIIRLTFVLIIFSVLQSFAGVNGSTVSIVMKDAEIGEVLVKIEKQGTFRFLFNNDLKEMKQEVDVSFDNDDITSVLDKLFEGTNFFFKKLDNNLIAIGSAEAGEPDVIVNGRVSGSSGDALSGVSVNVKGSSTGTTTNNNGEFSLVAPDNTTLIFSAVGFLSQEIAISGKTSVNIILQSSTLVMDEVVVIGYGTASKRDLTGSITKVAGKDIADKPNTNPVTALQGKVAGVYIINSGKPGEAPDVRIRGTNSINGYKPLYVVDGIFNDDINYVNPADIESIEILKDPSSLAIFGLRGANGVIVISTKRAKAGQVAVNFSSSVGFRKVTDKTKVTNAADFITL